jgi:hypothetical protein
VVLFIFGENSSIDGFAKREGMAENGKRWEFCGEFGSNVID